jgi:hypothetical protein
MVKFEYEQIDTTFVMTSLELNTRGKDGWLLSTVMTLRDGTYRYIFARPMEYK